MTIKIIGFIAAFLTTFSFLPQAIKTIKEKNTESISLLMYSMFSLGVFLWMIYGLVNHDSPLFIANVITFIFSFIILILKLRYK